MEKKTVWAAIEARHEHNCDVAKKVAALLAENAVTAREMRKVFELAEVYLTVKVKSSTPRPVQPEYQDHVDREPQ